MQSVPRGTALWCHLASASQIICIIIWCIYQESILLKTFVIYLVLRASKDFFSMQFILSKNFSTFVVHLQLRYLALY